MNTAPVESAVLGKLIIALLFSGPSYKLLSN
jgi:hypothetical protein